MHASPRLARRILAETVSSIVPLVVPSAFAADAEFPSLESFIARMVLVAAAPPRTLLVAVVYLKRLKAALDPGAALCGLECTGHRLFLAAMVLACKFLNDDSVKNSAWATASVFFTVEDVNLMEQQFLAYIGFELYVTQEDVEDVLTEIPPREKPRTVLAVVAVNAPLLIEMCDAAGAVADGVPVVVEQVVVSH